MTPKVGMRIIWNGRKDVSKPSEECPATITCVENDYFSVKWDNGSKFGFNSLSVHTFKDRFNIINKPIIIIIED